MENTSLLAIGLVMGSILVKTMVNISLARRRRERWRPADIGVTPHKDYTASHNMSLEFNDEFYVNLRKTISWTEDIISRIEDTSTIDYATVLRTTHGITPTAGINYNVVLNSALAVRTSTNLPDRKLEDMGRILQFQIDITTHDGAPCAEDGFVDESDIPPIDTWFYITQKYLYCWIPTMFIEVMQRAIDVEIFGSYVWIDEIDPQFMESAAPAS